MLAKMLGTAMEVRVEEVVVSNALLESRQLDLEGRLFSSTVFLRQLELDL